MAVGCQNRLTDDLHFVRKPGHAQMRRVTEAIATGGILDKDLIRYRVNEGAQQRMLLTLLLLGAFALINILATAEQAGNCAIGLAQWNLGRQTPRQFTDGIGGRIFPVADGFAVPQHA